MGLQEELVVLWVILAPMRDRVECLHFRQRVHRAPSFDVLNSIVMVVESRLAACTRISTIEKAVHVSVSLVFAREEHVAAVATLEEAL